MKWLRASKSTCSCEHCGGLQFTSASSTFSRCPTYSAAINRFLMRRRWQNSFFRPHLFISTHWARSCAVAKRLQQPWKWFQVSLWIVSSYWSLPFSCGPQLWLDLYQRIFEMPTRFANPPISFELIRKQSKASSAFWLPLSALFMISLIGALIFLFKHLNCWEEQSSG